jgi:small subunit ribosomal protein S3Ae
MAIKKQWYEIVAPKSFDERVVGETLAADAKQLVGRRIKVSMLELSRDAPKFYITLYFQVENVEGTKAYTKLVGHDCMRERIYRLVQRRLRRVDAVQDVVTKDGQKVRIKTVFVLIRRAGSSLKSETRAKCKEVVEKIAKEKTFEEFVKMVIADEIQQALRKDINKISPVGNVEVRKTELMSAKEKK